MIESKQPKATDLVWANEVDGKYQCRVMRGVDRHKGELSVRLGGEVLASKEVTIAYGGPFGPDAADENAWCAWCIEVADKHIFETSKKEES